MSFDKDFCYGFLKRYDDIELELLILDFPEVNKQISDGMRRDKKLLLLLKYCLIHPADGERLQTILEQEGQPPPAAESLVEKAEPWNLDFQVQINACSGPVFFDRQGPLVGLALRCEDQDVLDCFRRRLLRELSGLLSPDIVVDRRSLMIKNTSTSIEAAIQRVRDDFLPDAKTESVLFMTQMAGAETVLEFWKQLRTSLIDADLPFPMFVLLPVEPQYCRDCPTALANLGLADLGEPALAFNDVNLWIQDVAGSCHCPDPLKNRWKRHFWEQCGRGDLRRAYLYLDRVKTILMRDPSPANIQRQLGL